MPLVGAAFAGLITAQFAAVGFTGPKQPQLAMAIGNGVDNYILASNIYQGTSTGVGTGAGKGTGFVLGVVGPVVAAAINGQMASVGFTGTKALQLALAVGNAFSIHILTGQVQSVSAPVAIGVGNGTLKGIIGPAMGASIAGMMAAQGFTGTKQLQLAMSIGKGISSVLSKARVITTIVGAGYPPTPTSGTDIGKLI